MNTTELTWHRVNNSSISHRYEHDGIRATYGQYEWLPEKGHYACHYNANDLDTKDDRYVYGDCPDLLTAKWHAEMAVADLLEQRS